MEKSLVVLLAEDEALIAINLQDALEDAGFATHHVVTAEDAILALDTRQFEFCGLVTDIKLAGGADGWEIARHSRQLIPHLPVIYMSGDSAHEHTVNGVPESVMLQKPFAPAQLITALATLMNAAPSLPPTN